MPTVSEMQEELQQSGEENDAFANETLTSSMASLGTTERNQANNFKHATAENLKEIPEEITEL